MAGKDLIAVETPTDADAANAANTINATNIAATYMLTVKAGAD